MPIWLPFLPFILIIVGLFGFLGTTLMGQESVLLGGWLMMMLLILSGAIINLYVLYKWLKRRNGHFNRRLMLHDSFLDYLKELSHKKDIDITETVSDAKREIREAQREETEKNAVLYLALYLVFPPVLFYMYHFLNKDFLKHARREETIIEKFNVALNKLEIDEQIENFQRDYNYPDRNTIIYLVLTLVTAGLFGLYWIYTLTMDPNNHFEQHQKIETNMIETLKNIE
ncbi:MAG: putative membrane protein [Candidatus Methanohalarchaeum thermophilum]|uniref:Membrane protein n=1 Tax=Methanohalarchaeum thermophilum TaxID=1903181 RepID=A0A1Q6DWF6_METT1|nr:MAG: putative membrane protein [Candidatus Methanohalarchaeum thermophilum]